MIRVARVGGLEFRPLPGRASADPLPGLDDAAVRFVRVEPGPRAPHVHPDSSELIYVAEGSGRHWQGDGSVEVGRGDLVSVPRAVPHATVAREPLLLVCFFPHADPFATTEELDGELGL
jgi:quercetin dioxygenase-like cupin family protein